jgi:S1-C subfamily serine protease
MASYVCLQFIMKTIIQTLIIASLILSWNIALGQDKVYFDATGKASTESSAFYYRTCSGSDCKGYYLSGKPYFEGKIKSPHASDENLNQYSGICTWYYKNGKKQKVRNFNEQGKEDGTSTYYFESGNISRIERFKEGVLTNGVFEEFDENGTVNRVFDENFNDNRNDWDVYQSDQSKSSISNGALSLESTSKTGTSRFVNMPLEGNSFSCEMTFMKPDYKLTRQGMVFGHKDWQNYWFFTFQKGNFSVGEVHEGLTVTRANEFFCSPLAKGPETVTLKVICTGEKLIFSINGEIQYNSSYSKITGRNFGPVLGGKGKLTVDKLVFKELNVNSLNDERQTSSGNEKWSGAGTGFFIHESGLIATNHHVIDDAKEIEINYMEKDQPKKVKAKVLVSDKDNDLSILKVDDPSFKSLEPLKYSFKTGALANPGASVFSIGFPLFNVLGTEAKFSDGKISSKTGYQNAVNSFQTTVAIQPGNSGSPLFNDKGEVIGVANAIIKEADNVSYAIKVAYLVNLMELLPEPVSPPSRAIQTDMSLEEKIKLLRQYVTLIKVR